MKVVKTQRFSLEEQLRKDIQDDITNPLVTTEGVNREVRLWERCENLGGLV